MKVRTIPVAVTMTATMIAAIMLRPVAQAANRVNADDMLEEIVVTAGLRATTLRDLPQSVTVLDRATLQAAGVQHFEDVLGLVPGLSWASGTSRPRYFQLRGVGETEQYQGAPNPSVGFLIDDIDFSGAGMPATLFDLDRVEVLRGPSSTVYGANALAGLISLRSRDPGTVFDLRSEVTEGDFGTTAVGLAVGDGRADGSAGWRVAAQRFRSDGFRFNSYLGRHTNNYNETTLRGKVAWQPLPNLHTALTLLYADLDNGYDAWSVDNTRVTRSNQPGRDAQRSDGAALRLEYATGVGNLLSVSSGAVSHIDYSFDGDWGNDGYWGVNAPYNYFEAHRRARRTLAQDLRLVGDDAHKIFDRLLPVVGVYLLKLREVDAQLDVWNDQFYGSNQSLLHSDYAATNAALYGSLEWRTARAGTVNFGVRSEQRTADYHDSSDASFPTDRSRQIGGNLSWTRRTSDAWQHYLTLARSYKAGGFNIGARIDPEQRRFQAETLWNLETGLRYGSSERHLLLQAAVYAMRRVNMQVYSSHQLLANNPLTYVFLTSNAAHGDNIGVESELHWRPFARWSIGASASLQRTRYLGYSSGGLDLRGRAQAFAPFRRMAVDVSYQHPSGWFARADLQAQDGFYFSASHNQRALARELLNVRMGWRHDGWVLSLWAKNLLAERYALNGFYFADEPPDFPVKLYLQNGNPRQVGVTVTWDLSK